MGFIIFLTLLISIVALILAYKAYTRSGGNVDELRSSINELGLSTEKIRQMTADALAKMEKSLRGKEHGPTDAGENSDDKQQ
jgi:hypothetical protein